MKKGTGFLLAVVLSAVLFVGCTEKDAGNQDTDVQPKEKEVLTIMLNGVQANSYIEGTQEIIDEFNAENEYGVIIKPDFVSTNDYKEKLASMMARDAQPDIIYTFELGYLENYVNGGKIVSLQKYLDDDPQWMESFYKGTLEQLTYDGEVYGIPTAQSMAVMYYNKKIFEKYHLQIPDTYEEYCQICDTLLENGVTPAALAATSQDAWLVSQYVQQLSNGIAGYELFRGLKNGTRSWNDTDMVEAARLFQEEIKKGYYEENFTEADGMDAKILFQTGGTAMFFTGTWEIPDFSDPEVCSEGGHIGCFMMPPVKAENRNISVGSLDNSYAITTNCKNVEAAVEFLKFLTSKESAEKLLYEYGRMPATSIEADEERLSDLGKEVLALFEKQEALTPWLDRVNTKLGNRFNNQCILAAEGAEVQTLFDTLQEAAGERNQQEE